MRRLFIICLLALSATALVVSVPAAPAAKKKASTPSITRVMPMRISVGARLTILGKNFKTERKANTVIFRAPNGRSAFAKPRRASRTKLVVVVPSAVARLLGGSVNNPKPTRLKLRVLAGKFSAFTTRRLSPVVTSFGSGDGPGGGSPGGGSGGGGSTGGGSTGGGPAAAACASSADHDGDMLPNALEADLTTDPCLADTDGDGVGDGYEYKSAVDLNNDDYQEPNQSLPYPGKRPYPNPLDPSDTGTDFDGDSLLLAEESKLWKFAIDNGYAARTLSPLYYSDGEQYSINTRVQGDRRVPALLAAGYGKQADFLSRASGNGYRTVMLADSAPWWDHENRSAYGLLDFNRDGVESSTRLAGYSHSETLYWDAIVADGYLDDGERDEDADGLTNGDETHRRMVASWWAACYPSEEPFHISYSGTDVVDPDTDGDGVRDGADDQDHDDIPNVMELSRNAASGLDDTEDGKECKPRTGNFDVTGGPLPNSPMVVTFLGGQNVPQMTAAGSLTVETGTPPEVTVFTDREGGAGVDERQVVTITGAPEGGSFTLTFDGATTTAIAFDADAPTVDAVLEAHFEEDRSDVYGRVNPFDPCLPFRWSRTCPLTVDEHTFDRNWLSLN